jgi:hypothetical protein
LDMNVDPSHHCGQEQLIIASILNNIRAEL